MPLGKQRFVLLDGFLEATLAVKLFASLEYVLRRLREEEAGFEYVLRRNGLREEKASEEPGAHPRCLSRTTMARSARSSSSSISWRVLSPGVKRANSQASMVSR